MRYHKLDKEGKKMNDFWKSYDITHAEYGADYRCYPLYALCIPGAMLALLCPSWLDVPSWWTLINLHSVSIHALLVLYPVLLVAGGYRPSPRRVPQVLAFLFGSALPIYFLNQSLNTNFYFLNNPYGNIITSTFTALLGEKYYILGFLPATALALFLMYLPWAADDKKKKRA